MCLVPPRLVVARHLHPSLPTGIGVYEDAEAVAVYYTVHINKRVIIRTSFEVDERARAMLRNPRYVYGDMDDVMIPMNINFGDFMMKKLLKHGDKVAFVNAKTEQAKTYKQIAEESANIALSLCRMGVKKGQTVGICTENHLDFFSAFIGVACTGATLTIINYTYAKGEMDHAMNISRPNIVVCSPLAYDLQEHNFKTLDFIEKVYVFGKERVGYAVPWSSVSEGSCARADSFQAADVQGQTDPLVVLYSSGTTGLAKGVQLTHWNIISAIFAFYPEEPKQLSKEDISLFFAPWFHVLGLLMNLILVTYARRVVFLPQFELLLYLNSIQKYKISSIAVVPPLLVLLSKMGTDHDLSSIKRIIVAAAPISRETIDAIKRKLPNAEIHQGYGLTESTLATILNHPEKTVARLKVGSVGTLLPGVIVKVMGIRTREPLGSNEAGEICMKGPTMMKGYIGKDHYDVFDEEGFFKTGDIGYYDTDGFFFIVDRVKELIKYKGFQVPPAEIEAVLLQHEAVRDAGVVGIPDKDAGEVPLAFVALQPDRIVTEKELKQFVAERLSNPKKLRGGVRFVDDIPKNPSGKILRKQLRVMAAESKSKL